VTVEVNNYSGYEGEISIYDISADNAADAVPKPDFVNEVDGQYTKVWRSVIPSRTAWRVSYTGAGGGMIDVRGIEDNKKMVVDLDV
jgi:DNA topoisomerase-6 subunit B